MALSASSPRPTIAYQSIADHWGITSFTVRTPQNGDDNALEVTAESWTGSPGPDRGHVSALNVSVFAGEAAITPLLLAAGLIYEAARAQNVDRASAMYLALKKALEQAQQQLGTFPQDAT